VELPIGKEDEAYDGILSYLSTLNNSADVCSNILTFYGAINQPLAADTSPQSYAYPLANPYSVPDDMVSSRHSSG